MNHVNSSIPVLGFAAFSGTGKTTLLRQLIPLLRAQGLGIAMIKHAHHQFDIDQPGKDSYLLRKAGAQQMLIASDQRWALMHEYAHTSEPSLATLITQLDPAITDLILVEGFKNEAIAKIELHRPSLNKPLLCTHDPHIIALACDEPIALALDIPLLPLNEPQPIAHFILDHFLAKRVTS